MSTAWIIAIVGLLVFLAHAFTALFQRTRVPDVLLLITIGILLGPVLGLVHPGHFGKVGPVFAQVALAAAACDLGAKCRLFCVADAMQRPRFVEHEFTSLARACGAQVTLAGDLAEAQAQAELFAAGERTRYLVPLGFADEHFKRLMAEEIAWVWQCVCRELGGPPGRVWLPVGSGTLADCFRAVQPADVELLCVNVHVLDEGDARLMALSDRPGLRLIDAEEVFSQPARALPPIPSNIHYDAKLWRFIEQQGCDGDLWWNVAR